jgi:hypothetical protein
MGHQSAQRFRLSQLLQKYVSYGAGGFYPVDPLRASAHVLLTKGDLLTPTW